MTGYVEKGAVISPCGKYRYRLWREWRGTHDPKNWRWVDKDGNGDPYGWPKTCVFIMLNPSTADGNEDDPTIRRCVSFAKSWKFERIEVLNLFALRATDPRNLIGVNHDEDPVGWDNQRHVEEVTASGDCGLIVCAWGAHGGYLDQDETMLGWFHKPAYALGFTGAGLPRHPLYLPRTAQLVPMKARSARRAA